MLYTRRFSFAFRTPVWYTVGMNKAIKYRLYPTTEQAVMFLKTFGCCRKVYNLMLSDKIESYKSTGKFAAVTPARYKKEYPYLKEVDSLALANVQLDLQEAFGNCFSKSRKTNNGFPKFKSAKRSRKSYTTNCQYPKPSNKLKQPTIRIYDKSIVLPKVGCVKAVIHRKPSDGWMLKSATISMDCDGKFFASCLFEYEALIALNSSTDKVLGLDYKSDGLYMDSDGNIGSNHKYYRESHDKLAKAQRKLKNKTIGSNNYRKQQLRINRIHKHIANQRLENLHTLSTEIANRVDVVCVESLNMRSMSNKGFRNGKATMDNGYGMFLNMLEYKLADRGKRFIKVDKWFPSTQLCSCCGSRKKLALNERIYKCSCGLTIDRDLNAAINIRNEGLRILQSA